MQGAGGEDTPTASELRTSQRCDRRGRRARKSPDRRGAVGRAEERAAARRGERLRIRGKQCACRRRRIQGRRELPCTRERAGRAPRSHRWPRFRIREGRVFESIGRRTRPPYVTTYFARCGRANGSHPFFRDPRRGARASEGLGGIPRGRRRHLRTRGQDAPRDRREQSIVPRSDSTKARPGSGFFGS